MLHRNVLPFLVIYIYCVKVTIQGAVDDYACNSIPECKFFSDRIEKHLAGNPCKDFHSYTCNNKTQNEEAYIDKNLLLHYLQELNDDSKAYLDNNIYSDIKSLVIEKNLYDQCTKLGVATNFNHQNGLNHTKFNALYEKLNERLNSAWQSTDNEVNYLGFGHAFFNIRVIPDPSAINRNIILVEPPSVSTLTSINYFLNRIYGDSSFQIYNVTEVNRLQDVFIFKKSPAIEQFFDSWIDAINEASKAKYLQFPNKKYSRIQDWNKSYNDRYYLRNTNEINWNEVIRREFDSFGITIDYDEPVIIKNEPYFTKLFNLLHNTPNNITAQVVILKAVAENLRYINWNFAQQRWKALKISEFCLEETKLYGLSYKILFDLKTRNNIYRSSYDKIVEIVNNIIPAAREEIHLTSLPYKVKSYLSAELDKITIYLSENSWRTDSISNLYGEFEISNDNYLDSILSYRQMIKRNEFMLLKDKTRKLARLPFSITDLTNPANRFTLKLISLIKNLQHFQTHNSQLSKLPKEYYYGLYGAHIASFLYGLLNENKFEDVYKYNDLLIQPHPEYSHNILQCLITGDGSFKNEHGIVTISQLYGLQIAYKAMIYDDSDVANGRTGSLVFKDEFFFVIYSRTNCDKNPRTVNIVVSNIENFIFEFHCRNSPFYKGFNCSRAAFEEPNNRVYPIDLNIDNIV